MFDPNGIRLADGQKPIIDQVANGLYVVRNTYSGDYEYFAGRSLVSVEAPNQTPIPVEESLKQVPLAASE
jgi:hypothetical protein